MSEASRLPLYFMIGLSVLLHGFFLMGLPNLPWFSGPPDVFRLTRYVVRFAKPVPTVVPTLTQVAVAEPVPAEPAPVEPVTDRQIPEPVERVETPDRAREQRVAPVKPVVLEPPQPKKRRTVSPRERVVARAQPTRPDVAPVQPAPRRAAAKPQPRQPAAAQPRQPAVAQPQQPASEVDLQAQSELEGQLADQEQDALQAYLGLVFEKLESHKRYPRAAQRSGLNGRVVLRFTVRWDGEVVNPEVVEVIGHDSFRRSALQALTRVGQLPPFPEAIRRQDVLVEVPITYQIDER